MNIRHKLNRCTGFEWDDGNFDKNLVLHGVSAMECEEVFFNHPLVTRRDEAHSRREERYHSLGHTDSGRFLFVSFTVRGRSIRVISARDMTVREERIYLSL
jgi:hypothetical protein